MLIGANSTIFRVCGILALLNFCIASLKAEEPVIQRSLEVTPQLKVTTSSLKKSSRKNKYSFSMTVENTSAQALKGPLAFVIEKTGTEFLIPQKFDGRFTKDNQGFLIILSADRQLAPGMMIKRRNIELEALVEPTNDPVEDFELKSKIYQIKFVTEKLAQSNTQLRTNPLNSPNSMIPFSGNSSGTKSATSKGIQPIPDPGPGADEGDLGTPVAMNQPNPGRRGLMEERPRTPTDEEVAKARAVSEAWTEKLFEIEGVHTVAPNWALDGSAGLLVFVEDFHQKKNIPNQIDGIPVQVLSEEMSTLLDRRGSIHFPVLRDNVYCQEDPTQYFARPVPIGVSGWNRNLEFCATGTLGCRLEDELDNDQKYLLSNSHVLADNGRNLFAPRPASVGDPVIQPGPADSNCFFLPDSQVGQLYDWSVTRFTNENPNFNLIDAAIATTDPLFFSTATPCAGYGVPREDSTVATLGMPVMKYGRTTGFTTGLVVAESSTITVLIDTDINGNLILARFVGQIIVATNNLGLGEFSAGGDSGSLVVARDTRQPVGLLFAGNSITTDLNPIDTVLALMGSGTLRVDGEPAPIVVPTP